MTPERDFWSRVLDRNPTSDDLQQGDLIRSADVELDFDEAPFVVVVSQTCDLVRRHKAKRENLEPLFLPKWSWAIVAKCVPARPFLQQHYPGVEPQKLVQKGSLKHAMSWNNSSLGAIYVPSVESEDGGYFVSFDGLFPIQLVEAREEPERFSLDPYDRILDARRASIRSPWRERLGEMTAQLFSRVATDDPSVGEMSSELERCLS